MGENGPWRKEGRIFRMTFDPTSSSKESFPDLYNQYDSEIKPLEILFGKINHIKTKGSFAVLAIYRESL